MQIITDIETYKPLPCAATIGSFDGVHLGHRAMLAELRSAAQAQGLPLMAITFATHPRLLFGSDAAPFLLTPGDERLALLQSAGVDICVLLNFDSSMAALSAASFMENVLAKRLGVKLLGVGYDHHFGKPVQGEGLEQYIAYGRSVGIDVIGTAPFLKDNITVSSSAVRRALAGGDMQQANSMLGYNYSIEGMVEHGAAIGRTWGFPTANIRPTHSLKMLPADGVYEVAVELDGSSYKGVMNIGFKPTIADGGRRTIEVHIIGFQGNLYGKEIAPRIVRRLRGEMFFENVDALRRRIEADVARVKQGI